jgi:hypothetical protein
MKLSILDHIQFENPTVEQKNALLTMSVFVDKKYNNDFLILCGAAGTVRSFITTAFQKRKYTAFTKTTFVRQRNN